MAKQCILFDWGNTLMRDLPGFTGTMVSWPEVQVVPGVPEMLERLKDDFIFCLGTNAELSTSVEIRGALQRVAIDRYISRIYCYQEIGILKPSRRFFEAVLQDLELPAAQVVMVGDSLVNDVFGALQADMSGIWYNSISMDELRQERLETIHDFAELPWALDKLGFRISGELR